ncbi:MAG: hypothetical protein ACQEQ0_03960 [Bacteroidota bacterium]
MLHFVRIALTPDDQGHCELLSQKSLGHNAIHDRINGALKGPAWRLMR